MSSPRRLMSAPLAIGLLALAGCTGTYAGYYHPTQEAAVPPGHMPPPGECRIWYPDRPPGQQPPPGPCEDLQYQVPPGAQLVYGPPA